MTKKYSNGEPEPFNGQANDPNPAHNDKTADPIDRIGSFHYSAFLFSFYFEYFFSKSA